MTDAGVAQMKRLMLLVLVTCSCSPDDALREDLRFAGEMHRDGYKLGYADAISGRAPKGSKMGDCPVAGYVFLPETGSFRTLRFCDPGVRWAIQCEGFGREVESVLHEACELQGQQLCCTAGATTHCTRPEGPAPDKCVQRVRQENRQRRDAAGRERWKNASPELRADACEEMGLPRDCVAVDGSTLGGNP